jgi:hypothetical protein
MNRVVSRLIPDARHRRGCSRRQTAVETHRRSGRWTDGELICQSASQRNTRQHRVWRAQCGEIGPDRLYRRCWYHGCVLQSRLPGGSVTPHRERAAFVVCCPEPIRRLLITSEARCRQRPSPRHGRHHHIPQLIILRCRCDPYKRAPRVILIRLAVKQDKAIAVSCSISPIPE